MHTIAIPLPLFNRMKAAADKAGMKLRTFAERAIEAALKNGKAGK